MCDISKYILRSQLNIYIYETDKISFKWWFYTHTQKKTLYSDFINNKYPRGNSIFQQKVE